MAEKLSIYQGRVLRELRICPTSVADLNTRVDGRTRNSLELRGLIGKITDARGEHWYVLTARGQLVLGGIEPHP